MKTSSETTEQPHWVSRSAYQIVSILFLASELALAAVLYRQASYWLVAALVLLVGHLMHGSLVGFHEASHGLLQRNRRFNEANGVVLGILSFMSFSLYRAAHQTHHANLGTERDEELWPFVHPHMSRWKRVLAAFLELSVGLLFTPFLFQRTFFRSGSPIRQKKVRRRIWNEIVIIAIFWIIALAAVTYFQLGRYFVWMYLVPAIIAANLQSWRKYIEHVGLDGNTINSSTRSIIAEGWVGRLVSFSLLHEPFHGVHHKRAGLSHAELPQYAADLQPVAAQERPPFRSYSHALSDLLRNLPDPRVGAQWRNAESPSEWPAANAVHS